MENIKPLKNLARKMLNIMNEVKYVPKTGFNSFYKYSYATEADVTAALSTAFQKHGVFMFSSILERDCRTYQTRGNKESFMITIKLQLTFVDAESGESFNAIFFGDGSDADDKGIYKALTGAQKYALMKTFLVATGDDPEQEAKPAASNSTRPFNHLVLTEFLKAKAREGKEAFRREWKLLTLEQKNAMRKQLGEFEQLANEAEQFLLAESVQ